MSSAFISKTKRSATVFSVAILAAVGASAGTTAHATTLFVPGSTFEVDATNSPDTFTDTVNLAAGSQLIDGGAVTLNISIVPAGGTNEWLVFNYTTTSGGPLSGDEYWSVNQVGLDAARGVAGGRSIEGAGSAGVAQRAGVVMDDLHGGSR